MTRFTNWWQYRIGYDTPQRCVLDALGTLLVGSLLIGFDLDNHFSSPALGIETENLWWRLVTLLPMCGLVIAKAWWPQKALAAGGVVFSVDLVFSNGIGVTVGIFDLILGAASRSTTRQHRRIGYIIFAFTALATASAATVSHDPRLTVMVMLMCLAVLGTPYSWGSIVRKQTQLMAIAEERAKDAEQLAQLQHIDTVRSERARMARDLHDSLAGSLAAVAVNAEAALTLSKRPDTQKHMHASVQAIRESSVSALREMHTMIEVLRRDDADATFAPPRLEEIDNLVNTLRTAGHPIEMSRRNIGDLPAAVSQSAYRIVQESLSNATKHGDDAAIGVCIGRDGDVLSIRVSNDIGSRSKPGWQRSHGIGIASMRERAEAIGGSLTSRMSQDSTHWIVTARLPLTTDSTPALTP